VSPKVLMISYAFPPRHSVGSLRSAKFAKYLPSLGWTPVVLTRAWNPEHEDPTQQLTADIIATEYRDRLRLFRPNRSGGITLPDGAWTDKQTSGIKTRVRAFASYWLKEALAFPDEEAGWVRPALSAARLAVRQHDISMLFSTSPPVSSHVIASRLQRETGLPWIADFRDLWTQNHYIKHTLPRNALEEWLEKRTMRNAIHLATVSPTLASQLSALHGKPTTVITNGYDHEDYQDAVPQISDRFSLTYTGQLYAGKRDPSLLFAALGGLVKRGSIKPDTFQIRFYGPPGDVTLVRTLASEYGVEEFVVHHGSVTYSEAVMRQKESTALLLLNWDTPAERGVYTGKLFEYLGARRPILAIPSLRGVVDELLTKTRAGVSAGTSAEVARVLEGWYGQFLRAGAVPYEGIDSAIGQYTREAQTVKLAELFEDALCRR